MSRFNISGRTKLAAGAALLLGLGAAGGAGAVSLTRPTVEMAPTVATPIARLSSASGVVTVKGRVTDVFNDRVVIQDATGRTLIDAGQEARGSIARGAPLTVQGQVRDGQLRPSYLIDQTGAVRAVGPGGKGPGGHGPRGHEGPGRPGGPDGPRGPIEANGAPPPPPVNCAPAPGGVAAAPAAVPAPGATTPPPPAAAR
ncbi:hypothetical protein [Sphingomonas sp. RS2018]